MTMLLFKQVESNYGKKEPCERGYSWIINFLLIWILYTVNMVIFFQFEFKFGCTHCTHTKKKSVKWTTFDVFLRRVNFIFKFFQELASLLSAGKPFSSDLEC